MNARQIFHALIVIHTASNHTISLSNGFMRKSRLHFHRATPLAAPRATEVFERQIPTGCNKSSRQVWRKARCMS